MKKLYKKNKAVSGTDLFVWVTNYGMGSTGAIAWAAACGYDHVTLRPNLGQINIDPAYFEKYIDNKDIITSSMSTLLHEVIHLLGFSKTHIPFFVDPETFKVRPVTDSMFFAKHGQLRIKTPKVLEIARAHFNCPTINSVGFENGG